MTLTAAPPRLLAATATRRPLICQGRGIDRTAQSRYRTQVFIKVPLSTVWRVHTDVGCQD